MKSACLTGTEGRTEDVDMVVVENRELREREEVEVRDRAKREGCFELMLCSSLQKLDWFCTRDSEE